MRPFRCPVTILNTLDHLGKFDGKADEEFFIGYSTNSKAYRVFNSRTRIVEENLNVKFSEETPNIAGNGPNWLFDIDSLTISMNYKPVVLGNKLMVMQYILLPLLTFDPLLSKSLKDSPDAGFKPLGEEEKMDSEHPENEDSEVPNTEESRINQEQDANVNNTNNINTIVYSDNDEEVGAETDMNNLATIVPVSPIPTTRVHKDHPLEQIIGDIHSVEQRINHKDLQNCLFGYFLSQEEPKKVTQALTDLIWIEAIQDELLQFKLQKMDVKSTFLYGIIEEEVYVYQPSGFKDPEFPKKFTRFRRGTIDKTFFIKKDKYDILLVQVYVDDIIFGSTKKSLCTEFEQMMHKIFQMSSMGELTFFLKLQVKQKDDGIFISQDKYVADILKKFDFATMRTESTPMETNKALLKDEEDAYVDVHLYRSMIGSLIYLTASRPNIIYLKGQPKLGLWYPRDSPFDLEAFSDSEYAGASLDRKSTTGVKNPVFHSKTKHIEIRHHFIMDSYEKKLIQVIKIHTYHNVADLLTKAFDVAISIFDCKTQKPRKAKRTTEISQSSEPIPLITYETIIKEWEDIMERAATTTSSLVAEQDSGNINRTQSMATLNKSFSQETDSGSGPRCQDTILGVQNLKFDLRLHLNKSYDPPLSRVNTLGSGEDNMKLKELMDFCTKLSVRALDV
ncbi:putative ribonuclease H-like domain-containing protein [Tanacetum coccineum]